MSSSYGGVVPGIRPATRHGGTRRPLRLTRRGEVVLRTLLGLLAGLLVLVLVLLVGRPALAGAAGRPMPVRYHVVLPGETLWSIAAEVAPRADRRDTVAEIVQLNALPGSGVQAGQRIALPGRG